MKMLKISWFVFAPVVLLLSVFGVLAAIYLQGTQTIMGVNAIGASYIFVLIAVALAVALKIISLTDKTTSGFCLDKKSTASGVFALLLAVFAVLSCVESVITLFQQDVIDWFAFLNVVFSVLSVMAFAVAGAMHLSGKVFQYNFAMLLLMPSIWAVVNLFKIFAGLNTIAVATVDTSSLFFFMFFAVFAYWQAMVLNNMTSKSAIKSCFAYGLSLSALGISLAVRKITEICINGTIFSTPEDNMIIILSVLASGYAIAQLVTYTKRCRTMLEDKHLYEAQEEQEAAEADEDESDFKFPFSQTNTSRIPVIVPDATPREVPDILSYDDEPSSENMPDINTINSNLIGATDEFEIPAEAAAEKEPALEQPLKTAAETPEEAKKPEEPTQPEPLPEEEIKIENYDEEDADTLAAIDKLIEQLQ